MARRYTPRVRSRQRQPTTPQRVASPFGANRWPSAGRGATVPRAANVSAGGVPSSSVAAPAASPQLPPDASWTAAVDLLNKQGTDQIAAIAGERARTLSDYGFSEGPNGALTFDPNNAFSKASVMKKTYDDNRRSTALNMGAGGQLYSGSFQGKQDVINRNQLQSEDALQKNLAAFLARNTGQRTSAVTNWQTGLMQAEADRMGRLSTNQLYDPATSAPAPAAPVTSGPASAAAGAAAPKTTKVALSPTLGGRWLYEKRGNQWVPVRRMF